MKKLLSILLAVSWSILLFADDKNTTNIFDINQNKYKLSFGAAGVFKTSIYRNDENMIMPFPIFNANYDEFYIKGLEAGYIAKLSDNIYFSPVITYKFDGYNVKSGSYMDGMSNRNNSFYGGARLAYSNAANAFYFYALQDIAGNSNGALATIGYDYFYIKLPFIVSPSIKYTFQNAMYSNYYYGVNSSEATPTRSFYSPGNTGVFGANLYSAYNINKAFSIFSNLGYQIYNKQITNSPIVDKSSSLFIMLGVTFKIY